MERATSESSTESILHRRPRCGDTGVRQRDDLRKKDARTRSAVARGDGRRLAIASGTPAESGATVTMLFVLATE